MTSQAYREPGQPCKDVDVHGRLRTPDPTLPGAPIPDRRVGPQSAICRGSVAACFGTDGTPIRLPSNRSVSHTTTPTGLGSRDLPRSRSAPGTEAWDPFRADPPWMPVSPPFLNGWDPFRVTEESVGIVHDHPDKESKIGRRNGQFPPGTRPGPGRSSASDGGPIRQVEASGDALGGLEQPVERPGLARDGVPSGQGGRDRSPYCA